MDCIGQQSEELLAKKVMNERQNLKKYAFCQCLLHVYEKDTLLLKDGSSAGYFELGAYNIEVYNSIDSAALDYSKKIYKSKNDSPLGMMKCLDFYNSKELEEIVESFDKEIDKQKLGE